MHSSATWSSAVATVTGRGHDANQDAALAGPDWFVVADGMGGHAAGDVASSLVVEAFAGRSVDGDGLAAISAACDEAHRSIRRRAARDDTHGMGSTIVGLVATRRRGVVFHLGDSRCYRLVDGELRLLTRDHSVVQELIDAGRLTTEQARSHPLRNVVTRALGLDTVVRPETVVLDGRPSRLLLCSDGLTAELGPQTIGRVLAGADDPRAAAELLVELATANGPCDDATALVVDTPVTVDQDPRTERALLTVPLDA